MPAQRSTSPTPKSAPKPYARPSRSSRPKTYIDIDDSDDEPDHDKPPAFSSPSSDGSDRSSEYEPDIETPTKVKGNNNQLYSFDDEEDDVKPDFSDDEISYPGLVKDEHADEEDYGKGGKEKAKGKAAKKTITPKKPKATKGGSVSGSGKKPGVGWIGEEDWVLFQQIHPKGTPNWASIAGAVGRDAKVSLIKYKARADQQSCQNRYAVMAKKLPEMVKGMSGK
jgi:hypothetical protein